MCPHAVEPSRDSLTTIDSPLALPQAQTAEPHKVIIMAKSACPVSRAEFLRDAQPVEVTIHGIPMTAEVKQFSTGSLGWYLNGKATVKVGDKSVSVQIGMNLTIVGSKDLPKR